MINLNGRIMNVIETAGNGVVNHETIFRFNQKANVVTARYSGGMVLRGFLVGTLNNSKLQFKYSQEHDDGNIAGGESLCEISVQPNGILQMVENFEWSKGTGRNVFQELSSY